MYDYLIVGSGLFGAVFAHEMKQAGKSCLVLERRPHVGGNVYCEEKEGIHIHTYGAHIFHTSDKKVWNYVNQFVEFNNYVNSPVANYKGELYNLPFNMNTFAKMWGIVTPAEAAAKIAAQREAAGITEPKNLEEQAISLIGTDIYTKLIKGYTEKQWGRSCTDLPPFIIKRLPVRYTFDNNYFNDRYQGIPIIDEYFGYQLGRLEYRGLRFETKRLEEENHQGVAVMNYTDRETPYTRIIEHKHFEFGTQPVTYVTKEYPADWQPGEEAYYPVNNEQNQALYAQYQKLAAGEKGVLFGGRLAEYKYYDMDDVIASALSAVGGIL